MCETGSLAGNSETVPGSGDLFAGPGSLSAPLLHTSVVFDAVIRVDSGFSLISTCWFTKVSVLAESIRA